MSKIILKTLLTLLVLTFACSENKNAANKNEITVSAAASLQDAFREIGAEFEKQHNVKVNFNFAASGALQKQIEQGAPVDVFASAGRQQMKALSAQELLDDPTQFYSHFARNELILIASSDSKIKINNFADLFEKDNLRLAIGNPKTVPVGQYSQQLLEKFGVWKKMQPRLIFAEDVRQVLEYVARGEVEAGIVYVSDLKIAENRVREVARAPENSHDPIFYPIACLKNSRNKESAHMFLKFVLQEKAGIILKKYGFQTIENPGTEHFTIE